MRLAVIIKVFLLVCDHKAYLIRLTMNAVEIFKHAIFPLTQK